MSRSNPLPVIDPGFIYWPRAAVILVSASAAIAGLALGILIALPSPAQKPASNPDWTIAQCSASTHPEYTVPGWCVKSDGSLSHADR